MHAYVVYIRHHARDQFTRVHLRSYGHFSTLQYLPGACNSKCCSCFWPPRSTICVSGSYERGRPVFPGVIAKLGTVSGGERMIEIERERIRVKERENQIFMKYEIEI